MERTGARFSLNMVSAISAQGKLRFMTLKGRMNADHFIEFLERLVYRADRPIFLIVDGHPVHKSRRVREFVESTNGRLRLFVLPPYSPNLNSDEWVWNWLKSHRLGRMRMTGPDQLKHTVHHYLRQLQKLPETLRGFFRDPELSSILDDKSMSSKQLLS